MLTHRVTGRPPSDGRQVVMKPRFSISKDVVPVARQVSVPVTTMETVVVNKPVMVMEDTVVQRPKVTMEKMVINKQVTVKVGPASQSARRRGRNLSPPRATRPGRSETPVPVPSARPLWATTPAMHPLDLPCH